MDVLAHGLWAAAAAQGLRRSGRAVRVSAAGAWGVLPDLVAFALLVTFLLVGLVHGEFAWSDLAAPESLAGPSWNRHPVLQLTSLLYSLSHSALVFLAAFAAAWLGRGQAPWAMAAWGLHILLDVPTHARSFYPTPFLWPLSDWTVDGFAWTSSWVWVLNYGALALVWSRLLRGRKPTPKQGASDRE